jgi:hypothetical protein
MIISSAQHLGNMITHLTAVGDHVCQLIEIFAVIFNGYYYATSKLRISYDGYYYATSMLRVSYDGYEYATSML